MNLHKEQKRWRTALQIGCGLIVLVLSLVTIAGCQPSGDNSEGADGEQASADQNDTGTLSLRGSTIPSRETGTQAVEAQLISREGFFGAVEASGVMRGIQEATVVSETSGDIQSIRVRLGETVKSGQVLVTLDGSLERFAVEQARDQLAVTEIEFSAVQKLYESGNSSEAALARAKAAVSGSRSVLAQAQRRLGNRVIVAPVDGRVAVIPESISEGNFIQPGTVIAKVVNMGQIRIDVGLGEREIQMVSVGDRAQVYSDACGAEAQEATVRALAAGSSEQTGSFAVNIEFPNRCGPQLMSGMSARVEITSADQEASIIIPARALIREEGVDFVFVARQDGDMYFAQRREVEIDRILGDRIEVQSGLSEEEILIVAPVQILEDGVEINLSTIRG